MESRLSSGEFGQLTSIRPIIFEFSDFALGYAWQLRDSVKACALIFTHISGFSLAPRNVEVIDDSHVYLALIGNYAKAGILCY